MIKLSIDLKKIDQSKCRSHPNGAKYCDLVLIESPQNRFGNDYMVVQGVSKEDRDAGVKGAILGNGKNFETKRPANPQPPRKTAKPAPPESDDSVPF